MNEQNIRLDIAKSAIPGQIVRMGQGDSGGTTIRATVFDNSASVSLANATAAFCMRMPDGRHYVRDTNCSVSGSVITYVVNEETCCPIEGYTDEAYFEITSGGKTYSTSRFRVKIERSVRDDAEEAESWDSEIQEIIDAGREAIDSMGDYVEAENQRKANEQTRIANESTRRSNESTRQSNESTRQSNESSRAAAETSRASAETARDTAEQQRAASQTANNASQTANDTAQSQNNSAQQANTVEQARNNLDQQRNNEAAASGYARYLASGEYNPTTGKPTISAEGEVGMVITPNPDQSDPDNRMLEWARRTDDGGTTWTWELVGGTGWKPTPATSAQADSMWDDDVSVTSSNTPDVTWMTYYRTKIRQWVTDNFIASNTIARVSQVISSGEVQATVSNVVHKLSEKLNVADYRRALTWGEVKDSYTWGVLGTTQQTTGTTTTPNISLTKPGNNATVDVADLNGNSDILDTQIQALKDVVVNAKALLGQLGVDANGDPLVSASQARSTLDAAQDGGTTNITTLKAAETAITTLQDSVCRHTPVLAEVNADYASTNNVCAIYFHGTDGSLQRLTWSRSAIGYEVYENDEWTRCWAK